MNSHILASHLNLSSSPSSIVVYVSLRWSYSAPSSWPSKRSSKGRIQQMVIDHKAWQCDTRFWRTTRIWAAKLISSTHIFQLRHIWMFWPSFLGSCNILFCTATTSHKYYHRFGEKGTNKDASLVQYSKVASGWRESSGECRIDRRSERSGRRFECCERRLTVHPCQCTGIGPDGRRWACLPGACRPRWTRMTWRRSWE